MDKLHQFQIIFPYTSTKLHLAKNIESGSNSCYKELITSNKEVPFFIVHALDTNEFYHYEIPKFKNTITADVFQNKQSMDQQEQRLLKLENEVAEIKSAIKLLINRNELDKHR